MERDAGARNSFLEERVNRIGEETFVNSALFQAPEAGGFVVGYVVLVRQVFLLLENKRAANRDKDLADIGILERTRPKGGPE